MLALAGCGTTGSNNTTTNVTATGSTLTVYLSDPPAVKADPALQDVVLAERLSWVAHRGLVKSAALSLGNGTASASDNARSAIALTGLIAYVGEVANGESRQTVGILNAEDVLALSPTDTVIPGGNDFEDLSTYGRTFASLPVDLGTSATALEKAAPGFRAAFTRAYGHAPSTQAVEGYDAIWVLLRVLGGLRGQANSRTKVAASVIATLKANQGQASVPAFKLVLK